MRSSLLAIIVLTTAAGAQAPSGKVDTKHLRVETSTIQTGGKLLLVADITPKPKMHVYAPGQKDYIPVSLTLGANPAIKPAAPKFPKAETLVLLGETQLVYSKPFKIVQEVGLSGRSSNEPLTVTGTLRYQACDDAICYVPVNVALSWVVK